jgi:hypothetical protein
MGQRKHCRNPLLKLQKHEAASISGPPSDRFNHARRMVEYQPRAVGARAPQAVLPDLCDSSDSASAHGKLIAAAWWCATWVAHTCKDQLQRSAGP